MARTVDYSKKAEKIKEQQVLACICVKEHVML